MRIEKKQLVQNIGSLLEENPFFYMVSYKGLKVKEFDQFRRDLHEHRCKCYVLKNRLVAKAAEQKGIGGVAKLDLKGDSAFIAGDGDPGAVAKTLSDFAKKHEPLNIKGGLFEGAALDSADVQRIANLPPREVLLSQLLGTLQAPPRNLVSVLNTKLSGIVNVLDAYRKKKEESQ